MQLKEGTKVGSGSAELPACVPGVVSAGERWPGAGMAAVSVRGCVLCALSLLNFAFVFVSGADLVRFLSFRAIYHNITGETHICQGECSSSAPAAEARF